MRRFLLGMLVFSLGAGCAQTATAAVTFDGGYEFSRDQVTQQPTKGFGGGASVAVGEHFGLGARYSQARTAEFEDQGARGRRQFTTLSGSLSASAALLANTFLSASLGYSSARTRGLDEFANDPKQKVSGPSGSLSLSTRAADRLEAWIGPSYSYVDGVPGWSGFAGLGLRLADRLWLDSGYWRGESSYGWTAGLRAELGD